MTFQQKLVFLLFCVPFLVQAEQEVVNAKIIPDTAAAYRAKQEVHIVMKTDSEDLEIANLSTDSHVDIEILQKPAFPELIIRFNDAALHLDIGRLFVNYDSKTTLSKPSYFDRLSKEQSIVFPLTTDPEFLSKPSDEYAILPIKDLGQYQAVVHFVIDLIRNGASFKVGDHHHFNFQSDLGPINLDFVVQDITDDEIIMNAKANLVKQQEAEPMHIKGQSTIKFSRKNLLISQSNLKLNAKAQTKEMHPLVFGDIEISLLVDLTSKEADTFTIKKETQVEQEEESKV